MSSFITARDLDRRVDPRRVVHSRGVVVGPAFELGCTIVDASAGGLRLRLDRPMALQSPLFVIDVAAGTACEGEAVWSKGVEAGMKCRATTSLKGLVPSRLAAARAAWLRAGGR